MIQQDFKPTEPKSNVNMFGIGELRSIALERFTLHERSRRQRGRSPQKLHANHGVVVVI